jgi:hypothetical protein
LVIKEQMGLVLGRSGVVNMALEKRARITTGSKSRDKVRSKASKVTGVVADAPTMDNLRKKLWNIW